MKGKEIVPPYSRIYTPGCTLRESTFTIEAKNEASEGRWWEASQRCTTFYTECGIVAMKSKGEASHGHHLSY